jgi:hypothetical protein
VTRRSRQRARLPWGQYNRDIDQEWVRTFINIDAAGVDWTPMFAPPTDAIPWQLLDGVDKEDPKNVLGQVLAPFANKTVAYNGMYGCLPGTFRVAGLLQYRGRPQRPDKELRFYNDGTIIQQNGDFTQTGDFFPALQQLAGTTWQQIAAGGPDAYKVDCVKLEKHVARLVQRALHLRDGAGIRRLHAAVPRPRGPRRVAPRRERLGHPQPRRDRLGTGPAGHAGDLQDRRPGDAEVAHDLPVHRRHGRREAGHQRRHGAPVDARREDRRVHRAAALAVGGPEGRICVPWPPGDLLLSKYRRADDAIITPRSRRSRSSSAAPVSQPRLRLRPPDRGRRPPAYAAFADKSLRAHCIEMRKRLLTHPARMQVEYETVRAVDPEYADALRDARACRRPRSSAPRRR